MRAADKAWIVLGAYVAGYDLLAAPGETLSEGADSYMERHPWLTRSVALILSLHVCNAIPQRYDPLHWAFTCKHALRR